MQDVPIWHYLDLARYVGLLSRGLFFARPSALRASDPWEGCWGELDFIDFLQTAVHTNSDGASKANRILQERQKLLDRFGVSCWHASESESAAMWKIYVPLGAGIAIKSTSERLLASIGERKVDARRIDYGGHHGIQLGNDALTLLSKKRPQFAYKQELRLITELTDDEQTVISELYSLEDDKFRTVKPSQPKKVIFSGNAFSVKDNTCIHRCAPAGIHVPTDLTTLIETVILPPGCSYPLRRSVIDVTKSFGFESKVAIREAEYDLPTFDKVKFV